VTDRSLLRLHARFWERGEAVSVIPLEKADDAMAAKPLSPRNLRQSRELPVY
jgi:hypothetical protein